MDVANIINTQAQNAAAASKDRQNYEAFAKSGAGPSVAEKAQSVPPSEASKHLDSFQQQSRAFSFTNDKNIERERGIHEQVKAQLHKDGYTTKAAMIAQNYSSRSDKGRALMGS